MKKILVASSSCGRGVSREELAELFRSYGLEPEFRSLKESTDSLDGYEAILVGTETVGEELLSKALDCKVVMKYGVGTDNIDASACKARGIAVESMPGINSDTVAEMAFALLMSAGRLIPKSDRNVRSGGWQRDLGVSMLGKTLGIIGTGAIGRRLAGMVSGLKMKIIGYDVFENDEFRKIGEYVTLERLCREADFISVHVPLNNQTYHLIGKEQLQMMKPTAILVNTARGGIVDEDELVKALEEKMIKAAALDVYEGEKPQDGKLLGLDDLITTPHIAAYEYDTLRRMDRTAAEKLSALLCGKQVDKEC